jgi:O-antigen/teichoic acid export membrane protein
VDDVRGVEPVTVTADRRRAPRGSLQRALLFSSGGTAGARLTGAVGGLLAARLLGPSGRGQLAVLVFLATAASMAAAAGIQFWTAREVARSGGTAVVTWVVRAHAVVVVLTLGVVGLATTGLVRSLAEVGPVAVWLTVGVAVTNTLQLVLLAQPNGLRSMGVVAAALIMVGAVYVVVAASLLALDVRSVTLVLGGVVAGNVVSIAFLLAWATRAPRGVAPARRGRDAYRHALRFGLPAGAGELVMLAMLRVDVLIVAFFLPLRDVGLYAVATALAEILWIVPDGVAQVVLPTTARDPSATRTPRLIRATLIVTGGAGIVLVLVARPLIDLAFGSAFGHAAVAVPLLAVASLAGGVWKIVSSEVVALGHTRPRLWSAIAGLVVMVAIDLVAVPSLGIAGAALGSACAYAVAAAVITRSWASATRSSTRVLLGLASVPEVAS